MTTVQNDSVIEFGTRRVTPLGDRVYTRNRLVPDFGLVQHIVIDTPEEPDDDRSSEYFAT